MILHSTYPHMIFLRWICGLYLCLSRLPTYQRDTSGDGCHSWRSEAAEDGAARPTAATGRVQRGQEECQTSATGRCTQRLKTEPMHRPPSFSEIDFASNATWQYAIQQWKKEGSMLTVTVVVGHLTMILCSVCRVQISTHATSSDTELSQMQS